MDIFVYSSFFTYMTFLPGILSKCIRIICDTDKFVYAVRVVTGYIMRGRK